ncbi:MAG: hypothetical protein KGI26_04815 [Thaumarchaeota archaeon]|nr:hypothetical protein [Nitrososphaerota archaeon]
MDCRVCGRTVDGSTEAILEHFMKDSTHRDAALAVAKGSNGATTYAYRIVKELCEPTPALFA